jgi:acid phosphatase (class B)
MRKKLCSIVFVCVPVFVLRAADPLGVHTTTLPELAHGLPPEPVNVVFDVDDTVLFTSPGFQWGSHTYGASIVSAGVSVREEDLPTEEQRQKFREFWTKMNTELDEYSIRKWIAAELIALHKSRGDRILFVTKRIFTGSERLTQILRREFDLAPDSPPVIFTNRQDKMSAFLRIKAQISYGDSDGDIRDFAAVADRPDLGRPGWRSAS